MRVSAVRRASIWIARLVAMLAAIACAAGSPAAQERPWSQPRKPGDWSVRAPRPAAQDTAAASAMNPELAGMKLPLGRIAHFVDDAGRFVDLPETYQLAIEMVRAATGPTHPLLGYLHVLYARYLWEHLPPPSTARPYDPRDRRSGHSGYGGPAAVEGPRTQVLSEAIAGENILREAVRMDLRRMTDVDARRLAIHRESALDLVLTLAATGATPDQIATAWDAYLRSRAVVLDELAERRRTIVSSRDTTLSRLWLSLDEARSRLSRLSFAELGDDDRPADDIARARADVTRLEGEVAARSARFRVAIAQRSIGLADVLRRLGPGEALVGYAYYRDLTPEPPRPRPERWRPALPVPRDSVQVLAFVLPSVGQPARVVRLGPAGVLDALADRWRRTLGEAQGGDTARWAGANTIGDSLRRRAWDPIAPFVRGARRVHTVLDGALQLVNLSALPEDPRGSSFVIEHAPAFAYLSAERDLARPAPRTGHGLLAMGGAEFGDAPPGVDRGSGPAAGSDCRERRALRFGPLAATRDELAVVAERWRQDRSVARDSESVRLFLGADASERGFREFARDREAVHLATHGFYLEDSCFGARRSPGVSARAGQFVPPLEAEDDPLLASGIALAGANDRDRRAGPQDDGILTAAEIASLDLESAHWVVLSACETALGATATREGVLGLRRAFAAAGAGTLISSLWRVEDRQTVDFMRRLYDARFRDGEPTPEAMRDAALSLLQLRRGRGLSPRPTVWGAFIAVGPEE